MSEREMKKPVWIGVVLLGALSLAGCESMMTALGKTKSAPDEFAVYTRAPLSIPPDYALRPPSPGSVRPQAIETKIQAEQAVLGRATKTGRQPVVKTTLGLRTLLKNAGAFDVDPNIRAIVNQETLGMSQESDSITDTLVFWDAAKRNYGQIIDPAEESRRLKRRSAGLEEGTPAPAPAKQSNAPSIGRTLPQKKEESFLDKIF
jgi:hypothetical protein